MKLILTIILITFAAGCATAPRPTQAPPVQAPVASRVPVIHHTVRQGETLWSVSRMYGVELDKLIAANNIHDTTEIVKGQVLVIPAAGVVKEPIPYYCQTNECFIWPIRGCVIAPFGAKVDRIINKGIDIGACEGSSVRAARSGRVVYCDSQLKGFGKTVIIDHGDGLQTVYSYNSDILVSVGAGVSQSEVIAKVGKSGRAKEPSLHFEVRKDGEPQNPLFYLPR